VDIARNMLDNLRTLAKVAGSAKTAGSAPPHRDDRGKKRGREEAEEGKETHPPS
jgi:hypothetical protein